MPSSTRVMIFIDAQNIFLSVNGLYGKSTRVDYDKLAKKITGERKLIRVYFYDAPPKREMCSTEEEFRSRQRFLSAIEGLPYYRVVLGKLVARAPLPSEKCPQCGTLPKVRYQQKGVDVRMAVDMVQLALTNAYDTAILISGDSDLVSAVSVVQDQGKIVEMAFPHVSRSRELKDTCDITLSLTKTYLNDCLI